MMKQQQPQRQMHPATAACEFMQRAELKGAEVEVFAQTYNWLQAILEGELVLLEKRAFQEFEDNAELLERYKKEFGLFGDVGDSGGKSQGETPEVTGEPMEVTPENEPVGEDIPILAVDEDPQGAVDTSQL